MLVSLQINDIEITFVTPVLLTLKNTAGFVYVAIVRALQSDHCCMYRSCDSHE